MHRPSTVSVTGSSKSAVIGKVNVIITTLTIAQKNAVVPMNRFLLSLLLFDFLFVKKCVACVQTNSGVRVFDGDSTVPGYNDFDGDMQVC